jgi:hypothetical protein
VESAFSVVLRLWGSSATADENGTRTARGYAVVATEPVEDTIRAQMGPLVA